MLKKNIKLKGGRGGLSRNDNWDRQGYRQHEKDLAEKFLAIEDLKRPKKELLWMYKDPQVFFLCQLYSNIKKKGEVQGPFDDEDMTEWWELGYFPPTLLIKRVFQQYFVELGMLLKVSFRILKRYINSFRTKKHPLLQHRHFLFLSLKNRLHFQILAQMQAHPYQILKLRYPHT
jgi:hypothetical protein